MARESKTVQVYPDDVQVNAEIRRQELFGWEVISNQRIQEFTRQDSDGTRHYETFNKITFSREKSSPWYDRAVELETEYNLIRLRKTKELKEIATYSNLKAKYGYKSEVDNFKEPTKVEKPKVAKFVPFAIKMIIFAILAVISIIVVTAEEPGLAAMGIYIIPGAIAFFILAMVDVKSFKNGLKGEEAKKAKKEYAEYRKQLKEYNANTEHLIDKFFDDRLFEIEDEARALIK